MAESIREDVAADKTLRLSAVEQELVGAEVRAFGLLQRDPAAQARHASLAEQVESGHVPEDQLEELGVILEIGLQSGRLRRVYGPDGEQAISGLFRRTPRGKEVAEGAAAVTEALQSLRGQIIDDVRVTALGPGAYSLLLDTRQAQVTVRLDRGGARVESGALGL
jgi:hypothetical protein